MKEKLQDKIEDTIDRNAGAGTADTIEGKAQQVVGTAQQKLGAALESPELEARGIVNQADGKGQQAVGQTKHEVASVVETVRETAHNAAVKIKEVIKDA